MEKIPQKCPISFDVTPSPLLVVISGPSGVGKDAVLNRLKEESLSVKCIVTMTTRPRRDSEKDQVDYCFVSPEKFQEMIAREELLEYASVYGNWYGLPRSPVKEALEQGHDVVVRLDIQGAATIKKKVPQAVLVFLIPPSMDELLLRLKKRRTESSSELALRTKMAEEEMKSLPRFDYVVVNKHDRLDEAVSEIKAIITAEKCRITPREISLSL
ncbi:MAG: guanylate kinase [Chloroflexota bacterium]